MNRCSYIDITKEQQEMNILTHKKQLEDAAYTLKALANETRLSIVIQLAKHEEKTVSELVNDLNCEQSLLSHHLTDMRAKRILNCRKSGKNCYYSIKDERVIQLLDCILKKC
ncbi:MAG: metalloregulator ArsR/SmtB family transcription factor [Dysgonamonadaceae bacterium]|jgi:ArsR family transcriptional regulator|nr:metalloregulator ArsR/SmtB family transcription factor [Dysgonamonadaceae bacterium]MDD3309173.1 metalloregulator ArsR/SmtB family transcription factor [Dysgonamonadaceae bacterium]MDD3899725.1 metalloregulator ArsR/SmtB family transcription factor [Dysgonamonadaceae bacterium]MDD4397996.1 metalloregulator ArsR/SmtB family transcription factor [Dysgonamonadaceae bacterium]MEA5081635.1 metalloregulator ArsR/SmtB family transcription factor [Dysgonamonadaceae bacterium]